MRIPEINRIFNIKRSRKASLSLSINAIVVLVLAISMLGLGLAFTKSMFKKFGEKLTVPPPDIPATKDEPIVLPQEELEIRHGEEFIFQVNYFNDYSSGQVDAGISCSGGLKVYIASDDFEPTGWKGKTDYVKVAPQKVSAGTQKSFKFVIPKGATATNKAITEDDKTDVCEIQFCGPKNEDVAGAGDYSLSGKKGICANGPEYEASKQVTLKIV